MNMKAPDPVNHQLHDIVEALYKFCTGLANSTKILRGLGYGLLLLTIFDVADVLIPPRFTNPIWEFQTFGTIVERIALPLLGFAFIFIGERDGRSKVELGILKGLSWLSLLIAVLLWLGIPLGIVNTIRIDRQNNTQISTQVNQGKTQIKSIQDQLNTIATTDEMEALIKQVDSAGRAPEISGPEQLADVKKQMSSLLVQGETNLNNQAKTLQKDKRQVLLKSSVKWNLGALVSGALFFWIWLLTGWARKKAAR